MDTIHLSSLFIALLILVLISAFFSGAEIGMMSVNRYRLKHSAKKNKRAKRVLELLSAPDRLLGIILIGNTLANIIASSIATIIGQRLYGATGMAIATGLLTFIVLIFAEMTPKTLAALYPEKVAFSVSLLLKILSKIFAPLISFTNIISNGVLRLFGVKINYQSLDNKLTGDELRTVVSESGSFNSHKHKSMLLSLFDLEKVTVDDIMVPRGEIVGIDISEPWDDLLEKLQTAQHTRLAVFDGEIEKLKGLVHLRGILNLMAEQKLSLENMLELIEEPYFILEGTGLFEQLTRFQTEKKRSCFVVDEYGDIQGLVTLEDILEEVVGEFTTDMASMSKSVIQESSGVYLLDGSATIREINKILTWQLAVDGPKTINGFITDLLGFIPPAASCLKLNGYPCEILQVKDNAIKTLRLDLRK